MKNKQGEEQMKFCSSGKHVIMIDKIDCCLNCIRRRRRKQKSWKANRRTKFKRD